MQLKCSVANKHVNDPSIPENFISNKKEIKKIKLLSE